jgi:type II secretory pathway component GspD/PulD (secretin)
MLRLTLASVLCAVPAVALAKVGQEMPVVRLAGTAPGAAAQAPAPPPASSGRAPQARQQLPPLPVTEIDAVAALDAPRRLTLTFLEPRPIDEVLHLLVTGTAFSLAIDTDVSGAFRGELHDLTLREALSTLLTPLGLDFVLDGTTIHVMRRRADTRQFDLNVLDVRRGLERSTGPASASLASTVPATDAFAAIGEGVQALLSDAGRVHIDRRAGLATVTDYPDRLDRVALYLEALQTRSEREVRLQAQAFEVTLKAGSSSIDWRAVRETLGIPADAPLAGLGADEPALRAALAAQGDLRTLWSPEVTTINNEPALVRIDAPGVESLTLTVVPQISSDGVVQLAVTHTWEDRTADRNDGPATGTPARRVAEADTVTRLASGGSLLLSGLLRAVRIPKPATGAAALFGGQPKQDGYAELVVLLRPTIVTTGTRH